MNLLFVGTLTATLALVGATTENNPVLTDLLEKGVPMSGGAMVKLPRPSISDGLTVQGQSAAIARLAEPRYSLEDFTRNSNVAPFALDMRTIQLPQAPTPARGIDFAFIAYGDWATITSPSFLEGLVKGGDKPKDGQLGRSGSLSDAELAQRNLRVEKVPGREERFSYLTFTLFDKVELRATIDSVTTRQPDSVLVAARIDPRFNHDPQYPNQWRPITIDDAGQPRYGAPVPYDAAGFYVKVTQLIQPAHALLIEYHVVFDEPRGWFGGANLLRSKLPLVIQEQVRVFRRKFVHASQQHSE